MRYAFTPLAKLATAMGASLGILAGCGGSGGSSAFPPLTPPPKPPVTPTTFAELSTLAQTLYAEAIPVDQTPVANMPTTGKASYTGATAYVRKGDVPSSVPPNQQIDYVVANPTMVSNVNMTADFAKNTVGGSFGNFVDKTTGAWQGTVTMSNGTITGNTFKSDVAGSIGLAGAQKPTSGTADGYFGGPTPQYVVGSVLLTVGTPDPSSDLVGVMVGKQ